MNTYQEKKCFTEKEASTYIGMSRSFLRQARMTGPLQKKIPPPEFIKLGNRTIRYLRDDLDQWLSQFSKYQHTHQNNVGGN